MATYSTSRKRGQLKTAVEASATKSASQIASRDVFLSDPSLLPRRRLEINLFALLEGLSDIDDDSNREHNPDSEVDVSVQPEEEEDEEDTIVVDSSGIVHSSPAQVDYSNEWDIEEIAFEPDLHHAQRSFGPLSEAAFQKQEEILGSVNIDDKFEHLERNEPPRPLALNLPAGLVKLILFFLLFFTTAILATVADNTNAYASI
jgi:hypothetical protein